MKPEGKRKVKEDIENIRQEEWIFAAMKRLLVSGGTRWEPALEQRGRLPPRFQTHRWRSGLPPEELACCRAD